jgi:predicted PurR-regulated permease PerM
VSNDPWVRALVILCVLLASLALVFIGWLIASLFASTLLLFFLAWLLAFIIEPGATPLIKYARVPRSTAIGVAYLVVLLPVVLALVFLTPLLIHQVIQIATYLPTLVDQLHAGLDFVLSELTLRGINLDLEAALTPEELSGHARAAVPAILSNAVGAASGVASLLLQMTLLVIISYYIALDGSRLTHQLIRALPSRFRDEGELLAESFTRSFSGFLRGNVITAMAYGAGTAGIMAVAGLPYILFGSIASGICAVIPFIGAMLAIGVQLVIVLIAQSGSAIFVVIASIILQQIVYNVISPRVMSQSVGLHPLLTFLVLIAGTQVAGVWGAFFGIPVGAAIVAFCRSAYATHKLKQRAPAGPDPPARSAWEWGGGGWGAEYAGALRGGGLVSFLDFYYPPLSFIHTPPPPPPPPHSKIWLSEPSEHYQYHC